MLQLRAGDKTFPLGKKTVVGSDPSADVVLDDPAVKGTHCVLSGAGKRFMLMVLDPTAVVLVNGAQAGQKAVKAGDVLRIGAVDLLVEEAGAGMPANATLPPPDQPPSAMPVAATAASPVALVIKRGTDAGREFPLAGERATVGRHPDSTIRLEDGHVSATHGELVREGGRWHYRDVGSSAGSRVNGIKVDRIEVSDGDEIEVGNTTLVFRMKAGTGVPAPTPPTPSTPPTPATPAEGPVAPPIEGGPSAAPEIDRPDTGAPAIDGDVPRAPAISGGIERAPAISADSDDVPTPEPILAGPKPAVPYFEVLNGPDAGKTLPVRPGLTAIGRDPRSDVALTDPSVSGSHGELRFEEGRFHYKDLGSTGGSKVNGIGVDSLEVSPGDELQIGNSTLVLREPALGQGPAAVPGTPAEPALSAAAPSTPSTPATPSAVGPRLVVTAGPDAGRQFALPAGTVKIGRDPRHDIALTDGRVSGTHAELQFTAGVLRFSDSGSTAGSKVNGIAVDHIDLADGDELLLGDTTLRVELPAGVEPGPAPPSPAPTSPAEAEEEELSEAVGYSLLGMDGAIDGKVFLLFGTAVIGTAEGCEVRLPPETGAAARHAEIFEAGLGPAIRRLEADVTVQDVPVELLPLTHGDVIGCGAARLLMRRVGAPAIAAAAPAPVAPEAAPAVARHQLRIRGGQEDGLEHPLIGVVRIGRDPARSDLTLSDPAVSGRHCEVFPTADGWSVRDVGSSAGTVLDGGRVQGERELRHGARLLVGNTTLVFEDTEAALEAAAAIPAATPAHGAPSPAGPKPPPTTGVRKVRPTQTANPNAHALLVVAGATRGERYEFGGAVRLGRHHGNDLVLDDPEVSNDHARIRERDGRFVFEDLKSTNGSRINDLAVTEKILNHGDVIELGDTEFMFLEPGREIPALDRYARPSLVQIGDNKRRVARYRIPPTLTMGRAVGNGVVVDDTEVSAEHCRIEDRHGQFWLIDSSTNGTRLNGKRVKAEVRLHHGDVLALGSVRFAFKEANKSLEVQELRGSQVAVMLVGTLLTAALIGLIAWLWPKSEDTGPTRTNLLVLNPSFDADLAGGELPGWTLQADAGMQGARVGESGAGQLQLTAAEGPVGPQSRFTALHTGPVEWRSRCAWELLGKIRGTGNTGGAGYRLRFLRADGTPILERYTGFFSGTDNAWRDVSVLVRSPTDAVGVEVAAVAWGEVKTVRFDDVRLYAMPLSDSDVEKKTPKTERTNAQDQFGALSIAVDPRGVISVSRDGVELFDAVWFELRGTAEDPPEGPPLVRVDQRLGRPKGPAVVTGKGGKFIQIEGTVYDFAAGEPLNYTVSVRPVDPGSGEVIGGLLFEVDLDPPKAAGARAVEALLHFEGARGRADWANRRLPAGGGKATESGSDFPDWQPGVGTWVIGRGAGEVAVRLEPPAMLRGVWAPTREAVDAEARASADFQGASFGCRFLAAGPDTTDSYSTLKANIDAAVKREPPVPGEEYQAIADFLKLFAWVGSDAGPFGQRQQAIASAAEDAFAAMKAAIGPFIQMLEGLAKRGEPVGDEQQASFAAKLADLQEFRRRYAGVPISEEAHTLEKALQAAYDEAFVGARAKRVDAVLAEAQAAFEAGDFVLARILVESYTRWQPGLLKNIGKQREALFALLNEMNAIQGDGDIRRADFDMAKKRAREAEAMGDVEAAIEAWRMYLKKFPDRALRGDAEPPPDTSPRDKADEEIRRLTRKR